MEHSPAARPRSRPHRDNGRRRWADAARPWRTARQHWGGRRLYFHTFKLPLPAWVGLYDPRAARAARAMVAHAFPGQRSRWKLERSEGGALHVHAAVPCPVPAVPLDSWHVASVYALRRLLAYMAKPADARMCRARLAPWSPSYAARRAAYFAALNERGAAIAARRAVGKSRLAPLCGWVGPIPTPYSALVTACLQLMARALRRTAALLATEARPGPSWPTEARHWPTAPQRTPRPAQGLPRPREAERTLCGLRV